MTERSERPISRWISCVRPPTLPAVASRVVRVDVARGSIPYSGSHPALAGAAEELRDAVLDAGRAHDARAAGLDEHRAFRVHHRVGSHGDRSQLRRPTAINAHGLLSSVRRSGGGPEGPPYNDDVVALAEPPVRAVPNSGVPSLAPECPPYNWLSSLAALAPRRHDPLRVPSSSGRRRSTWPASVSTSCPSIRICTAVIAGRLSVNALTIVYTVRISSIDPPGWLCAISGDRSTYASPRSLMNSSFSVVPSGIADIAGAAPARAAPR